MFYPELDKANYAVYLTLPKPNDATLTDINLHHQDKDFTYTFYSRSIFAVYQTHANQNEILDFFQDQLASAGWKHYDSHPIEDEQGKKIYNQYDYFRRDNSCITLITSQVKTEDIFVYAIDIYHDFLLQNFSLRKQMFFIIHNNRYAIFASCHE